MNRSRTDRRTADRRPDLEALEARQLLSQIHKPTAHHALRRLVAHTASATVQVADPTDGFDQLDEATSARVQFGVDGTGQAAAVIDTGVNYDNSALGGGFGPGKKVEDGYDFADGTADPDATTSQHGTAVAGILASDDPNHPGVAPGADIVALRVFGDSNNGDFDKVADALQWVIDNHAKDDITVVNLSISDGNNYSLDFYSSDGGIGQRISTLVDQLAALNIPVVTAAGNSFNGQQGTGFPSILPNTISVTATDGGSSIASDAQRLGPIGGTSATDLAAPGVGLTAPVQGDDIATVDGTSFAAPQVSGAIILLQQIYEQRFGSLPTVSALEGWLKAGSVPVHDSATGITIGRLDILKAAEQIPAAPTNTIITSTTPTPAPVLAPVTTPPTPAPSTTTPTTPSVTQTPTDEVKSAPPAPVVSTTPITPITTPPAASTTPISPMTTPTTTTTVATPAPVKPAVATTPAPAPTTPTPVVTPPATVATPSSSQNPSPAVSSATPRVNLIYNGETQGSVDAGSEADPFSSFSALFGVGTTFSQVQVWDSVPSANAPGTPTPTGTVHIMLERAKRTPTHVTRAKRVPKAPVVSRRPKFPKAI